jgi:transposase-like protein
MGRRRKSDWKYPSCPECGHLMGKIGTFVRRKKNPGKYYRYRCPNCGLSWVSDQKVES